MSKAQELRDAISALMDEADAITATVAEEERDLTDDEKARIDAIIGTGKDGDAPGEVDKIQQDLDRWERIEKRQQEAAQARDPHGIRDALTTTTGTSEPDITIHATARRYGSRSLKCFVGDNDAGRAEDRAYKFGMFGLALAARCMPNRYSFPRAEAFVDRMMAAAHGSEGSSGAHYTVPEEFSSDIIDLKERRGVARQLLARESMASETKLTPRRATGLTTYAVGENAAGTESNMTLDNVLLVARKWMTLARMSKELDEDNAVGFGDRLAQEIAYSQADKEDESAFNGDGTSTYHGIVGVRTRLQDVDDAGTDSAGLKTQGTGSTWGAIVLGDFDSVVGALPDYADTNETVWVTSRTFYYEVMEALAQASGGVPAMEIREGERRPRPIFKGYPVVFSQVFPKATATTSVVAALGDFNVSAMFGERRGLDIEFSDQVYVNGQSVWERDQIAVKGTQRYDIKIHDFGTSAVAGGIVGLETGS